MAIPGARRPETARSAARAATLELSAEDQAALTVASAAPAPAATRRERGRGALGEVVIVMGIPGAGKSGLAAGYVERGYVRLNRDERGGSLRALAGELDEQLAAGLRHAVLDNTYLTRAARSHVVETAERHSLAVRASGSTPRWPRLRSTSSSGCWSVRLAARHPSRSAQRRDVNRG